MNLTLAVFLFLIAAFFAPGAAWLACASLAADSRAAKVMFRGLAFLAALVVAVLAAAGWRLS